MKRLIIVYCLLAICSVAQADTHESIATGNWSAVDTWDSNPNPVPVNGDTVNINSPHVVTFDVDMTGWANGVTLTIDDGATLICKTTAGTYYLMTSADITLNGTLQAGTSVAVPLPTGTTFEGNFNAGSNSIVCGATGVIKLYCLQPTNRWIKLSAGEAIGQTELSVDTDVTGDIWAAGDEIVIANIDDTDDCEIRTIAAGGIAAGSITVTAGLTAAKLAGAYVVLVTRNIRLDNSTDYAIKTLVTPTSYIAAEFQTNYGMNTCKNVEIAGVMSCKSFYSLRDSGNCVISGVFVSQNNTSVYGPYTVSNLVCTTTSAIIGFQWGSFQTFSAAYNGLVAGCTAGLSNCSNIYIYGDVLYCTSGISACHGVILANCTLDSLRDMIGVSSGRAYNVAFNGTTEFYLYGDATVRSEFDYFESFDHDQVVNAFKAWCLGGVVTSQTASPPTGYTIWYEHACEDVDYPCFRQYETTVSPDTAIEVTGYIRIADAADHSAYPPALQIVDKFADPLVDSTQSYLDFDAVAEPNGAAAGWQAVSVIWANSGDAPRQVIVRMYAQHATGDVDEVWSIANYQTQIQAIYAATVTDAAGANIAADIIALKAESVSILEDTGTTIPGLINDVNDNIAASFADIPTTEEIRIEMDANSTDFNTIIADTNELQTDWKNGGRLDLLIDAIKAVTDILEIQLTTVSDANDANSFTLTAGVAAAYAYEGNTIYVQDANDSHWESRMIISWTSARVVLVDEPFAFTPAVGDAVVIWKDYLSPYIYNNLMKRIKPAPTVIDYSVPSGGGTTTLDVFGNDP